jgi:hypothetical protein
MYEPQILDIMVHATAIVEQVSYTNKKLGYWLTETGNSIGVDAVEKFTDSYAAGFMYRTPCPCYIFISYFLFYLM